MGNSHKHMRNAGAGTTGAERCNVRHVSAGEGMSSMADSMNTTADTLANAMREVATTLHLANVAIAPSRTIVDANTNVPTAIGLIKQNEDLSDNEFSDAAQCITKNPIITTVYLSMSKQALRSRYIRKQVNGFRGLEG